MELSNYRAELDRGASRWKEACWVLCRLIFFLPRMPLPSSLRAAVLRAFGARIGAGLVIRGGVNITFPWRLTVGDHVWIGEEVWILNLAAVTIASHTCISQRAFLCTGSHNFRSPRFDLITRPIEIGSGCWIAASALIGPGVRVGDNSMVYAGAVLTRNVPADSIVRGNPGEVQLKDESSQDA